MEIDDKIYICEFIAKEELKRKKTLREAQEQRKRIVMDTFKDCFVFGDDEVTDGYGNLISCSMGFKPADISTLSPEKREMYKEFLHYIGK